MFKQLKKEIEQEINTMLYALAKATENNDVDAINEIGSQLDDVMYNLLDKTDYKKWSDTYCEGTYEQMEHLTLQLMNEYLGG